MKIAVNTRLLIHDKLDGIGWFSFETLKRITRNHPEHEFYFIFDRRYDDSFIFSDNITPIVAGPQSRHPFLWYVWFEHTLSRVLKRLQADLFLSPDGYLSLSTNVKSIPVIHDINFVHRPQDLPFFTRHYYNYYFRRFAEKAQLVATVSEYSKKDIMTQYNIKSEKVKVVYNGCNELYIPVDESVKTDTKRFYTNGKNYFVFVGTLHPRKNIARLFRAFTQYKRESKSDFKLLIVGTKLFMTKDIEKAYQESEFKKDIIFTGRLAPEKLHHVLASAFAMTFVPVFEGFGIPLLEAMNVEIPIISSDQTSLPEVAGNAALYVDPYSVGSIKDAMITITKDHVLRNDLIIKGNIRKHYFSWDKTAQNLWNLIEEIM